MKHNNSPTVDPGQPVDLTIEHPPFLDQATPFTISGLAIEQATDIQAAVEADYVKQGKVRSTAGKATVEAVREPEILTGRRATIAARLYDLSHGRNMYELLKQKRQDERDLAMAQKLGLITTDRCAKHERQLAMVRGIQ